MQLSDLKGVGPATAVKLKQLGLLEALDVLFHLPLRYEDRTRLTPLAELQPGQPAQVEVAVVKCYTTRGRRSMMICELSDGETLLSAKFFHYFHSQKAAFRPGRRVRLFGDFTRGLFGLECVHPEYRFLDGSEAQLDDALRPIYPKTEGLSQKLLQNIAAQALDALLDGSLHLPELLPEAALSELHLPDLQSALVQVHRPEPGADTRALVAGDHPAQQRLMLEEVLAHLLTMAKVRARQDRRRAQPLHADAGLMQAFTQALPFELTAAQQRVNAEIQADLQRARPMQRLVQGDVGSGKTVVAAMAMHAVRACGRQAVMMAPTEILAEQHLHSLLQWFEADEVVFLSGAVKGVARREALKRIAEGCAVAVGTHALFQDEVEFNDLALVVIDEQHRFGVHQRLAIKQKGRQGALHPHTLIMTATPIPRTLAQLAYANLDLSVIDELPPGRVPVNTVLLSNSKMPELAERIRDACARGEQAYWVCTLIEESDKLRASAAADTARDLADMFPDLRIGLVHGQLKASEKKSVMAHFKSGAIDLLVATTVIEVGVDVPNASLMVIENAERLGLSQLHQLRGRVGRGRRHSHCVLMYQAPLGEIARQRLETMRNTTDGFEIARMDLKLRGPGEILGTRQKGEIGFRLANIETHPELIEQARTLAECMRREHPQACDALIRRWNREAEKLAAV